ncbi:MAG: hypothetical protein GY829_05405 [Gammaproteobacteria bacterium]|nr:hypothetical protein [Gammaproteobacteria bacterium]
MLTNHTSIKEYNSISEDAETKLMALNALIEKNKLGLNSPTGQFNPVSLTLSPWKLSPSLFQRAKDTASALSRLFLQVSRNNNYLKMSLADYNNSSDLLGQMKQVIKTHLKITATSINISRQDLMLNNNYQWQLVESNSIAAGMGPFCETLINIQKQLPQNQSINYVDNDATALQSQAIFRAASAISNNHRPLIIFVIEAGEDNIYDQKMLANGIKEYGGIVIYKTLRELKRELSSNSTHLQLENYGQVDMMYFRTGYNLKDYIVDNEQLLQLRVWIEQHQVAVAPGINHQIATSKWLQMKLSTLTVRELVDNFKLNQHQATLAASALNSRYIIPENRKEIEQKLLTGQWILKTQNEGGGNVFDENSDLSITGNNSNQLMLMEKINTIYRTDTVKAFSNDQVVTFQKLIPELGIFTLEDEHCFGGYLLRSKPANKLEAGVHKGEGLLDCIGQLL